MKDMKIKVLIVLLSMFFFSCISKQENKTKPTTNNIESAHKIKEKGASFFSESNEMVYFSGGIFNMGSSTEIQQERTFHQEEVHSFWIDKHPVTVKEFRLFVQSSGYQSDADRYGDSGVFNFSNFTWELIPGANWEYPLGKNMPIAEDDYPVTQVSWNDAVAYATWAGKRLPTEIEWEYAASCGGKNNTKFSWGNDLIENGKYMANVWQGSELTSLQGADGFKLTSPVGYYGETPCGLTDMGGNVWNWCLDTFKPYPGRITSNQNNPELKVIRGGSFFFDQNGENSYSCKSRNSNTQETSLFNIGFRCAKNAE